MDIRGYGLREVSCVGKDGQAPQMRALGDECP